jgi:hypothetical protein
VSGWSDGPPVNTVAWSYPSLQWTAGTEFVYTVPSGVMQRLLGARLTLDVSGSGSTRFAGYKLLDPHGNQMYLARTIIGISGTNQPIMNIGPGPVFGSGGQALPDMAGAGNGTIVGWTLHYPDVWLWPGCQFSTSTLGLLPADQWATYNLHFEQIPLALGAFVYP